MNKSNPTKSMPEGFIALPKTARRPLRGAKYLGPVDEKEVFEVSILLRGRPDGLPLPDADYYAKTPPDMRKRFSAEEFASTFGAHPEDVKKVVRFAEKYGLKVVETDLSWRKVKVSGTAAQMSQAFGVSLRSYQYVITRKLRNKPHNLVSTYRGHAGPVHIPKELAGIVVNVVGLDNRNISHHASDDPPNTNPVTVQQMRQLYNFPTNNATGQTIAICSMGWGLGGYLTSDLQSYFGGSMPTVTAVSVESGIGNSTNELAITANAAAGSNVLTLASTAAIPLYSWVDIFLGANVYEAYVTAKTATTLTLSTMDASYNWVDAPLPSAIPSGTHIFINLDAEADLDICVSGSAAPGANIAMYFSNGDAQGWIDLIQRVATPQSGDPVCHILSCSWFISGGDDSATLQNWGVSSSDVGSISAAIQTAAANGLTILVASGDWGSDSQVGDGAAHVIYPASDPYVLGVGGTTVGNIGRNNNPLAFDEYVWNDDTGATGGGVSDHFALPSYQQHVSVPNSVNDSSHSGRGVPDVAANASGNSGYTLYLGGHSVVVGGTSAAAPLWAGLLAVINAALGSHVGFINPSLYAFGESVFNDIIAPPGPLDNGYNGAPGYPAGAGWDACTGLGSPNGQAILNALQLQHVVCPPISCLPTRIFCLPQMLCNPARICPPAIRLCQPRLVYPCIPQVVCAPLGITTCGPIEVFDPGEPGYDPEVIQQIEQIREQVAILKA